MFEKYNISNLRRGVENPRLIKNELSNYFGPIFLSGVSPYYRLHKYKFETKYSKEELISNKDWDVLILLDACRYDLFEKINNINGNLESYVSAGSHSIEFAKKIFKTKGYMIRYMLQLMHMAQG